MADLPKEHHLLDPFAITPDTDVYVPREATVLASQKLFDSVRDPEKCTALIGPPGLGKSLLIQMLAARVGDEWKTVYLPYAALPPQELGAWALRRLGSPTADDPAEVLRGLGEHLLEEQSALLIAIDDAGLLPVETAQWLGRLVAGSNGALRLLIAASDDVTSSRTIAAIGTAFNVVFLSQPMSESETAQYIEHRLALARIPDSVRQRFDAPTVHQLHRESDGIPSNLHTAAAAVLRGTPTETQPVLIERDPVLESLIDAQMVSPQPVVEPTATIVPPHPVRRIESPPSRSRVLLGALIVVGVSVAIPLIGWLLPEPTPPPSTAAKAPMVVETADLGSAAKSEAKSVAPPSELGPAAAPVDTELLGPFPVQVNATPWARVRVDGIDFGETPLANIPLLAGPHTFHVQMSDGRVIERIVEIDAEQRFVSFE